MTHVIISSVLSLAGFLLFWAFNVATKQWQKANEAEINWFKKQPGNENLTLYPKNHSATAFTIGMFTLGSIIYLAIAILLFVFGPENNS